jgi:hypothetical protein
MALRVTRLHGVLIGCYRTAAHTLRGVEIGVTLQRLGSDIDGRNSIFATHAETVTGGESRRLGPKVTIHGDFSHFLKVTKVTFLCTASGLSGHAL